MGLSVSLSGIAKSLINSFGDDIVIRTKVIDNTYDPIAGTNVETITEHNAKGVYSDYFSEESAGGDGKMTIHSAIEINKHATIIHNSMERRIIDIVNVQMQNDIIIYEVVLATDNKALS